MVREMKIDVAQGRLLGHIPEMDMQLKDCRLTMKDGPVCYAYLDTGVAAMKLYMAELEVLARECRK